MKILHTPKDGMYIVYIRNIKSETLGHHEGVGCVD